MGLSPVTPTISGGGPKLYGVGSMIYVSALMGDGSYRNTFIAEENDFPASMNQTARSLLLEQYLGIPVANFICTMQPWELAHPGEWDPKASYEWNTVVGASVTGWCNKMRDRQDKLTAFHWKTLQDRKERRIDMHGRFCVRSREGNYECVPESEVRKIYPSAFEAFVMPELPKATTPAPVHETVPQEPQKQHEYKKVPSTMRELSNLCGCFGKCCKYEIGVKAVSPAGHTPTVDGASKAWKKNAILAVARALVAREYGKNFVTSDVVTSIKEDWDTKSNLKKYREVLPEGEPVTEFVRGFIEGNIESEAAYLSKFKGVRWSIVPYLKYISVSLRMDLKKDAKKV